MCAIQDKKLSNKIGSHGIFKKVMLFMLVGISNIVDTQVIGHDSVLRTAVIFFYISNEGISILENAAHLGLPVPTRLKEVLAGMHSEKEEGKEAVLNEEELPSAEVDINAVIGTVKDTVRFAVKETLMEAASEIGAFPSANSITQKTRKEDEATPIIDGNPTADLSDGGFKR